MRNTGRIAAELSVLGERLRPLTGSAVWAVLLGILLAGALPAAAQEPDAEGLTNELSTAEILARISAMVQSANSGQSEEMNGPEDQGATNSLPQADLASQNGSRLERGPRSDSSNRIQGPVQSQESDRRSRGRRSSRSKSDQSGSSRSNSNFARSPDRDASAGASGTNGGPASLDYAAFRLIVDRNIFDPNRVPRRPNAPVQRAPARTIDSLTLVGTMAYERGSFAFFDGTSSDYKKALKLTDVIAGYRLTNISPAGVKLSAGTNELELKVGMQLRREENGPWTLSGQPGTYAAIAAAPSTNAVTASAGASSQAAPSAADLEIIKKLMQRRERE